MAKNTPAPAAEGAEVAAESEEDTGMVVDVHPETGLPITVTKDGAFIPKIPKAFFFGENVKEGVDGYDKKTAFLTYVRDSLNYRLEQHKALKDPVLAKAAKIAKLKAELARLGG